MKIADLSFEELEKARINAHLGANSTFVSGWLAAIEFAKFIESCSCRCHKCHTPVQPPSLSKRSNYGGDICGELVFCKSCWSTLSHEEKMKMANELIPKK